MSIDKKYIEAAYRFLLNRRPENDQVIKHYVESVSNIDDLYNIFVTSEEYLKKLNEMSVAKYCHLKDINIDVKVPQELLNKMFKRINKEWQDLSQSDPYWAVIISDEYKRKNMGEKEYEKFYRSGKDDVDILISAIERNKINISININL